MRSAARSFRGQFLVRICFMITFWAVSFFRLGLATFFCHEGVVTTWARFVDGFVP